ncbi:hypothetical protein F66182_5408, partial [Fusarium sp. NRRL 66182]
MTQSPPKRRARPSSGHEADDAALKVHHLSRPHLPHLPHISHLTTNTHPQSRRERNREAQNIFRRRRQAAEAAQAQRVRRLEQVVEEMSSVFMSFVDEILTTEAVVTTQPSLVGSIRTSMERMLKLAREVVGPEEDAVALPRESDSSESCETPGSCLGTVQALAGTRMDLSCQQEPQGLDSSTVLTLRRPPPTSASSTLSLASTPRFTDTSPKPFIPPFSLPPQIFGHGWLGTT